MKKENKYILIITVLALVCLVQGIFIAKKFLVKRRTLPKPPVELVKGKIAIVIDDWGYNLKNIPLLKKIKEPLTLAILPNISYSSRVAEEAHRLGLEVILHLPMEPHEKRRLEKNTIMVDSGKSKIAKIIDEDLKSIVYAKGVSNHMGSRITEEPEILQLVLKELRRRHIYFLDSFVSPESVAKEVAREAGVAYARRDIFLDNDSNPAYIQEQLHKLKKIADKKGYAVGIGHDRRNTLEVLAELMPQMKKQGYIFVFVSELAD